MSHIKPQTIFQTTGTPSNDATATEDSGDTLSSFRNLPIGMFDSGVGGLTVLKALRRRLPCENIVYLGDTARLPYGTKSPETITRYAVQASAKLVERGIKLLVVACNTASSVALDALRESCKGIPVIGVVEPGAQASCRASKEGNIAVIATESTIRGRAYQKAIVRLRPGAHVTGLACPLFVALAEEGWCDGELVEGIAARYLDPVFNPASGSDTPHSPDCLVLGCTHFPLLAGAIRNVIGPDISIVDSAETTAQTVEQALTDQNMLRISPECGDTEFLTTDDVSRFARTGSQFLGTPIGMNEIELVDL